MVVTAKGFWERPAGRSFLACARKVVARGTTLKCDASKFLQLFPVLPFWVVVYDISGLVSWDAADAFLAFRDLHDNVFLRRVGQCTSEHLDDFGAGLS